MVHYLLLFVAAVFVNNVVLSQFLGICPFLGVSKKVDTATGMGAAVTFVLAISTLCTFLLQKFVLEPLGMEYMQTISFILVIAALVQMVEIILKKVSPALYQALGAFLYSDFADTPWQLASHTVFADFHFSLYNLFFFS